MFTGTSPAETLGRTQVPDLYPLLRPALFRLPAEPAHRLTQLAIAGGLDRLLLDRAPPDPKPAILAQQLLGLTFANPVGLAAGFDKDARVAAAVEGWGFGFIEIGTLTPRAQQGNPRPRLFRLDEDEAIVNRMGFNNRGLEAAIAQLLRRRPQGVLGVNLGTNRDSADPIADYEEGVRRASAVADYLTINVSSPNTPGLRDLQRRDALESLLRRVTAARTAAPRPVPLLLKIAPDLLPEEKRDIAGLAVDFAIDGLVVSNTTVMRPASLRSPHANETGGLSGRPLFAASTALLAEMHRLTRRRLPLIGVGGIAGADEAYAKIRAGASLVQIYTTLIFSGPAVVRRIGLGLAERLRRDGFATVADAVGVDGGA